MRHFETSLKTTNALGALGKSECFLGIQPLQGLEIKNVESVHPVIFETFSELDWQTDHLWSHTAALTQTTRCCSTYLVDKIGSAHCTDLGRVVYEADVSLSGGVQLSDRNVPEAIQKLRPNVCPDPVANGNLHFVVLFIVFLQTVRSALISDS